jgi:Uma2 family endonuclease
MVAARDNEEARMTVSTRALPRGLTVADLLERLGGIPGHRVRLDPVPGRATEKDVIRLQEREGRLYELVDGVLVEKVMGHLESCLAAELIRLIGNASAAGGLGFVAAPDGAVRLMPGLIRIPDVAFTRWERLGRKEFTKEPIPDLAPDLAVEVLSEGNTEGEMRRKVKEYFLSGTRLVWLVDPSTRTVRTYVAPDQVSTLTEGQTLTGGEILPGLTLPVTQVFACVPRNLRRPGGRKAKGSGQRTKKK